jgi:hypothetical protein
MSQGPAEQISIGRALARLGVNRAFRTTVQFSHRGQAPITLNCRILRDANELITDARGIRTEQRVMTIVVTANQTGFQPATGDPELVLPGDTCVVSKYANRTYQVIPPIQLDVGGRVYTLKLVEKKRMGAGT